MDRSELLKKRERLQAKLRVAEQNRMLVMFWSPYLQELSDSGARFQLEYLVYCSEDDAEWWKELIEAEPWRSLGVTPAHIRTSGRNYHNEMFDRFESVLPLRYLPDLPPYDCHQENLQTEDAKTIAPFFEHKEAILICSRFNPVLKLENLNEDLSILPLPPLEDVMICTPSFDTILFRSMEDEWRFLHP